MHPTISWVTKARITARPSCVTGLLPIFSWHGEGYSHLRESTFSAPYPRRRVPPHRCRFPAIENLCRLMVNGHTSGIYFLCDGQDVVYVGQSVSALGRVATHLAERIKEFLPERVFFLPCPAEDLTRIENHYIRLLRPKYNTIGNPQRKPREPKAKSAAETAAKSGTGRSRPG